MDYIIYSIPVFIVLIAVELIWSAWSKAKVYRFNDFIANLGCGIGSQIVGAFSKTFLFAAYLWIYDHFRLFNLETTVLTWVVAFLLVDMLYYWFHRLSHEVNFMWAAHIVHHQSEEYNLSVALRQSWWQGFFSWWFYVPMAILGIHPLVIVTVAAVNTLYQFWIHTKAIGTMGPFEWVFNTPSHHRVHHGSDPKYIDRNHAGTLIIWDKLFGTFQPEEEEPIYGITEPLRSWDPVRANFHYWGDLFALAGRCDRWSDKVRVFLKPPGWHPKELGGFQGPKQKDRALYRKFNARTSRSIDAYVLVQFILLLITTSFFLFRQADLDAWQHWAFAGVIILWVMDLGLLVQGVKWAQHMDVLRVIATVGLLISVPMINTLPLAPFMLIAFGCASIVHLLIAVRSNRPSVLDH